MIVAVTRCGVLFLIYLSTIVISMFALIIQHAESRKSPERMQKESRNTHTIIPLPANAGTGKFGIIWYLFAAEIVIYVIERVSAGAPRTSEGETSEGEGPQRAKDPREDRHRSLPQCSAQIRANSIHANSVASMIEASPFGRYQS
jgi:hypothetical protein